MVEKRTIRREVSFSGVGVHSGGSVTLNLKPSSTGRLIFRRLDLGSREIELDPWKAETRNCTALVSGKDAILTVEHVLAVLFVLGIDSLEVEVNGPEIPILDGSALPLAEAILEAGIRPLAVRKKCVRVVKSHTLCENQASLTFSPADDLRITYAIDFPHPLVRRQEYSLALTQPAFLREIAPARTFAFLKDVPELRRKGLAAGGSLENAVVLDEEKVISGPLRFSDEFVRHKILDLIGDLSLFGHPLLGHFRAERAGHSLHLKAVRFLLSNPDYWAFDAAAGPRFLEG